MVVHDEPEHWTSSGGSSELQVNPVDVEGKVHGHVEDVSQRLEEKTQVDPLLQSVFGEHHHAQDVGRGAGKKKKKKKRKREKKRKRDCVYIIVINTGLIRWINSKDHCRHKSIEFVSSSFCFVYFFCCLFLLCFCFCFL